MKTPFLRLLIFPAIILTSQTGRGEERPDLFGSKEEFTGLTGNLYDLKNTADREPTDMAPDGKVKYDECYEAIEDLAKKGFRDKDLDEYATGDITRDLKALAIKTTDANIVPTAFGSPEIEATGIIIVYKGTIEEAPEKKIRFGGWFDDAMLVLVNGEVVFYTAWREGKTRYKSEEFGKQRAAMIKETGGVTGLGDAYGEYLQLKKGDVVQIVIAEIPGGRVGGALKVQEEGKTYRKDDHGDPILPPFVVGKLSRDEEEALENTPLKLKFTSIPKFKFVENE
ncbi:MAG: hypothetical protein ACSHX7_09960 [Luteolibacter sp.]